MFRSLRSRLSLTYLLLIGIVFCMALLVLTLIVRNIPVRTTRIRLQELSRLALSAEQIKDLPAERQAEVLHAVAKRFEVRILIIGRGGTILSDTGAGTLPAIERLPPPAPPDPNGIPFPSGAVRDAEHGLWQYTVRPLDERRSLVLAAPRPRIQWLSILRDDLLPPLLWSTGLAVLLAILIAGFTARWVSGPLGKMVAATRRIPGGGYAPIEEAGPEEVQQLARAFNIMIRQVEAGQQSQRDFVANVSHELKTPLTSIQGFAQAIRDGTAAGREAIDRAAGVIYDEAGRMHRLVVDLLDLARIEGGAAAFRFAPVDLTALLETVASRFKPLARAAGVTLGTDLPELAPLSGDGDRLLQVFTNLMDNAIKNTPAGGRVSLRTESDGDSALIFFEDTGPGIPPAEQDRIFERFYQLDKSRLHSGRAGFGLGLAIAREIIQAHNGRIELDSEPGRGGVFVVKIPFTQAEN